MTLIHESYVFELRTETKSEVCDPCSFRYATYNSNKKELNVIWMLTLVVPVFYQLRSE